MAPALRVSVLGWLGLMIAACFPALADPAFARPAPSRWTASTGDAFEQGVIDFLNEVRANPRPAPNAPDDTFWTFYADAGARFDMGASWVTPYAAVDYTDVRLPSLTESGLLNDAAQAHADYLGANGLQTHVGLDGLTPGGRIRALGFNSAMIAEELAFSARSPSDVIVKLLIDSGVPGAPHRRDLLNPVFTFVGVGCASHPHYGNVCVIELSSAPLGGVTTQAQGDAPAQAASPSAGAGDRFPRTSGLRQRGAFSGARTDSILPPGIAAPNGDSPSACNPAVVGTYSLPLGEFLGFLLTDPTGGIPIPDLVLAGIAYRPTLPFEPEPDISWNNWTDFDGAATETGGCGKWIRARLVGGDYGGFELAPAPYTSGADEDEDADDGLPPM